jgi:hypothetical protein
MFASFYLFNCEVWKGFCYNLKNHSRQTYLPLFTLGIHKVTMEHNEIFKNNLFHVQYIMLYILIQVNDNIEKLVRLMVEDCWKKIMEFKCNTHIVL